jgi:hypothetical protein
MGLQTHLETLVASLLYLKRMIECISLPLMVRECPLSYRQCVSSLESNIKDVEVCRKPTQAKLSLCKNQHFQIFFSDPTNKSLPKYSDRPVSKGGCNHVRHLLRGPDVKLSNVLWEIGLRGCDGK